MKGIEEEGRANLAATYAPTDAGWGGVRGSLRKRNCVAHAEGGRKDSR
jgi:hypothetical protein